MQRGRRIAFDYGDVRIGVATSDADEVLEKYEEDDAND
jgi:RNase H-fold protein (predicted Holliday junction resolvase)